MENANIKESVLEINQNNLSTHPKAIFGIKSFIILGIFILAIIWTTCVNTIKPGEVGVVIDLLGESKGVEPKEISVGVYFIPFWKSVYNFPIYEQNHQWIGEEGFNFQTSEGLPVHANIGINFNLEKNKIHNLFCKYRRGMEEITHLFVKNTIRDAMNRIASKMKIEDLYGPKKEDFIYEVRNIVSSELGPIGFNISQIFIIDKFDVPEIVKEALNKKIEATQRAQQRENELRESGSSSKKRNGAC